MFEQTFKNIDDILHKDAGCISELDYTEQSSCTASSSAPAGRRPSNTKSAKSLARSKTASRAATTCAT
ncbi:MAG: hypothetical protein WA134_08625 [Rhodoferax sp.]|uniref:hypothetical protein n=1 Tax=Rhodoferax sp. TaxID=50421 RepID=UPI003BB5E0BB